MFKLVVALSAWCLFSSCSSFAWKNSDTIRIESENQILKKKLLQVERRNQIIEDENSGCRKDLADSNTRNESLVAEVRSTNEARANESRMWQQKYDNL